MPHQLCAFEHGEVLRNRWLRDAGMFRQCVDRSLALARQFLEDCPASGVGERAEDVIGGCLRHTITITIWLWFVKPLGLQDTPFHKLTRVSSFEKLDMDS